jgi:hypothetical protein
MPIGVGAVGEQATEHRLSAFSSAVNPAFSDSHGGCR